MCWSLLQQTKNYHSSHINGLNNLMRLFTLAIALLLSTTTAYAQQHTFHGTVTSFSDQEALVGATVKLSSKTSVVIL